MANRFGGFGGGFGGGNMQAMMKQAQKMQQDAMRAKEELENTVFEGSASGEMVKVEVNGAFEMVSVKINPAVVDADDVEMLEDLIVAAYNDAKAKIDEKKASSLGAFGGTYLVDINQIEPIARLINEFSKLPSVGKKTAERYAYHIIRASDEGAKNFADAIMNVKAKIKFCEVCGNYTETSPCRVCRERSSKTICVVKEPKDAMAIERTSSFKGAYHILHGTINPLAGVGPNDIRLKELLSRVAENQTEEVIIATNPDVEGEATAMYIAKLLKPLGVKVSRIAQGISMGSELEYADEVTLSRALSDRKEM